MKFNAIYYKEDVDILNKIPSERRCPRQIIVETHLKLYLTSYSNRSIM